MPGAADGIGGLDYGVKGAAARAALQRVLGFEFVR
jgi:hypothetical protein